MAAALSQADLPAQTVTASMSFKKVGNVLLVQGASPVRSAVASIVALAALSACAHGPVTVWVKPGASQSDFAQARYNCMQQSQQRVSTAFVNQYGGAANNSVITNQNLFGACMNAQGWSLQQQPSAEQGKAAMAEVVQEAKQLCTRPDLQPHFTKTPCMPEDTTLEQMADKSHISDQSDPEETFSDGYRKGIIISRKTTGTVA
jgi:hypothetical protein